MNTTNDTRKRALRFVAAHPAQFIFQVGKGFRKNQGLLLAGAIAYYALLSIVPLLILAVIAFSHFIGEQLLLDTLERLHFPPLQHRRPDPIKQRWPALRNPVDTPFRPAIPPGTSASTKTSAPTTPLPTMCRST